MSFKVGDKVVVTTEEDSPEIQKGFTGTINSEFDDLGGYFVIIDQRTKEENENTDSQEPAGYYFWETELALGKTPSQTLIEKWMK